MKKPIILFITIFIFAFFTLGSCAKDENSLNAKDPVTLTMWHVYGEQADSPMNELLDEFNRTEGKQKGVIINVMLTSNAIQIGEKLLQAQSGKFGAQPMPDLFFCHKSDAKSLGEENLVNWKEEFSQSELDEFIPSFISDGTINDKLSILPTTKSTHLLFVASGVFARFSEATGVTYDDLQTWEGFFAVADKYKEWSGKPFCAFDYMLRAVELDAVAKGDDNLYDSDGWYDENDEIFNSAYTPFARALAKGSVIVSDMYANTQIMTGEVIAGVGSSAALLYYNDKITHPDGTSEPIAPKVLPAPHSNGYKVYAPQAGVGLSANKTTIKKRRAAAVFARWFTQKKRNLEFAADTGYMPVKKGAFDEMKDADFSSTAFSDLYDALRKTQASAEFLSENDSAAYYAKTNEVYKKIRTLQKSLDKKYAEGATEEQVAKEFRNCLK